MRSRTSYLLHTTPIVRPKPLRRNVEPPESLGKIVLLSTGRVGALSPRDRNGKRKSLGVHDTYSEANQRLQRWRLATSVGAFCAWVAGLATGGRE